jgi:hypothetical protein
MKSYKLNYYNNKLKNSEKYKAFLKSDARKLISHNSYVKRKAKLQSALEQQNQLLEKKLNEQLQLNQPQAVSAGPFHLQIHQQLNQPQINKQLTSNQKPQAVSAGPFHLQINQQINQQLKQQSQINKQHQTQNNKWLYPGFYQIHQN